MRVVVMAMLVAATAASTADMLDAKATCSDVLSNKALSSSDWLSMVSQNDQRVALAQRSFCRTQVPAAFLETESQTSHLPADFEEEEIEWERQEVTGEVPEPRMGAALGMVDGEMLVAGGCSKQHRCFRDLYFLNTASMTWRKRDVTGIAPSRQGTSSIVVGPKVYVFGGYDGQMYNSIHVLDTTTGLWSEMAASGEIPPGRMNAAMSKGEGNSIYVFGGTSDVLLFNDFYRLDLTTATWEKIEHTGAAGTAPTAREGSTLSIVGNRLFLFGGYGIPTTGGAAVALGDLWVFSTESRMWRSPGRDEMGGSAHAPWPRRGHSAVVVGDRIEYFGGCTLAGGETTGCFQDVVTLDVGTMVWSRPLVKNQPPEPRAGAKAIALGRNLLFFGGCDEKKTCFADLHTGRLKFSTHRPSCPDVTDAEGVNTESGFQTECPMNCTGRGICHQGTCFCDPGYEGADCSRSLSCPNDCTGQGECHNGRCYCNPGYKGIDCATPELCPRNCSYRGVCHNGHCECDPGYSGMDCSRVVVCPNNCTKRGICLNGACFCSPGYGGAGCEVTLPCPANCSSNGICHRQKCFCNPGWTGHDCSAPAQCPSDCSGRGMCLHGQCHCDPSYGGPSCNKTAVCPKQCNQRGVCLHDRCVCEPGFSGPDCSKELFRCQGNCSRHGVCRFGKCYCYPGFEGETCDTTIVCPNNCTNHGVCLDGKCLCSQGFGGSDCSHGLACPNKCSNNGLCKEGRCFCDLGYAGLDCSVTFPCPNDCSGNGKCMNGKCYCDAGHSGRDCANTLMCNASCNGHGECANGKCFCDPGYYGHSCDKVFKCMGKCNVAKGNGVCKNGQCHCFPGFRGIDCDEEVKCPDDCNHRGACQNGQCYCNPGYTGMSCELSTPCPSQCRGHGTCQNGRCYCDPGFAGDDCSTRLECPDDCYNHGQCHHGQCFCDPGYTGATCGQLAECVKAECEDGNLEPCSCHGECQMGKCFCDPGFAGDDCATPVSCPANCNGHGICVGGKCQCVAGRGGRACEDAVDAGGSSGTACPNDCSNQGACMGDGTCECNAGFTGDDCSTAIANAVAFVEEAMSMQPVAHRHRHKQDNPQPVLPLTPALEPSGDAPVKSGDSNQCNGHGTYTNGRCFCDPDWSGDACDEQSTCLNSCNSRGACRMGLCYCEPGYVGEDCSETLSCPNDCSGNGVCWYGRCSCDAAHDGADCSDSRPRGELSGLTVTELTLVCGATFVGGLFAGLGIKSQMDKRRKAKFNSMLQSEVNRPFVSGS